MPSEDPDPTDPLTLHGVMFETEGTDAVREMAACMVEEYCRSRFSRERIWKLFTSKEYAGPYLAYKTLGAQTISDLIDECLLRRRPQSNRLPLDKNENGDFMLPVLDG